MERTKLLRNKQDGFRNENGPKMKTSYKMDVKQKVKESRYGYLFVSPYFIIFTIFSLIPILYSLYLSFTSWDGFTEPVFIGLDNYRRILGDQFFFKSIGNTLIIWIFSIVPQVLLALALALMLNEKFIKGRDFFTAVYYFPNIITPVTLGVLFALMFNWKTGSVNNFLVSIGMISEQINWFNSPLLSRIIVATVIMWQNFGFNMLVFLSGLQAIPNDVYESAEIDGANKWQQIRYVTLPLIKPVLFFVGITSVIGGLQLFDAPLMLGKGPNNTTLTMVMYLYDTAFKKFSFGYGAAVAYAIFVVIMLATLVTSLITMRKKKGESK